MNPKIDHEVHEDIKKGIQEYKRISVKEKKDCDSDPCLMEILIIGYVIEIRKSISEGVWPFTTPTVNKEPQI